MPTTTAVIFIGLGKICVCDSCLFMFSQIVRSFSQTLGCFDSLFKEGY